MEEKRKLIDDRITKLRDELDGFWENVNYGDYFEGRENEIRFHDDTINTTNNTILESAKGWFEGLPALMLRPNDHWHKRYVDMAQDVVEEEYSALLASEYGG
jgi:hypothetical protein